MRLTATELEKFCPGDECDMEALRDYLNIPEDRYFSVNLFGNRGLVRLRERRVARREKISKSSG